MDAVEKDKDEAHDTGPSISYCCLLGTRYCIHVRVVGIYSLVLAIALSIVRLHRRKGYWRGSDPPLLRFSAFLHLGDSL
jgi:hypothetical protein